MYGTYQEEIDQFKEHRALYIKAFREIRGESLRSFAARLRISTDTLRRIEDGGPLAWETIERLLKLGCSREALLPERAAVKAAAAGVRGPQESLPLPDSADLAAPL